MSITKKELSAEQTEQLLWVLKSRFEQNMSRHEGLAWDNIYEKLQTQPAKLWSLNEMERTGGEPDVAGYDESRAEYLFYDCAAESPAGRRSFCYDRDALDARKEFKPADNVVDAAAAMGVEILTEDQYRALQQLGKFDTKTSSWLATPAAIRKLGGAIFGDRRYNHVFISHNGVQSYYAARGFRAMIRI
jgi:hypothetical protein